MKEHPILMATESVRAILNGSKTQSRRVITPQPEVVSDGVVTCLNWKGIGCGSILGNAQDYLRTKCPYGQVGDRLWVRETWHSIEHPSDKNKEFVTYKATAHPHLLKTVKWKPSIFMPRWASRITLEITGLRVERLQEISATDVLAEGIDFEEVLNESREHGVYHDHLGRLHDVSPQIRPYKKLWDSLNAKRGYGWDSNCWVWVISFKVVK